MPDRPSPRPVICRALFAAVLASAAPWAGAQASGTAPERAPIVQQRTSDGRIVITDRPVAGAITERTWQHVPEDSAAASQRREQARLDALAVSDRVQRYLDAQLQREQELNLARMQLAAAQAARDAELARAAEVAEPAVVFFPARQWRPPPHRPPGKPGPHPRPRPRGPMLAGPQI
jgi:hypothetical protein